MVDIAEGLDWLMNQRALNKKRGAVLRGKEEELAKLRRSEIIFRARKDAAAALAEAILVEMERLQLGLLSPAQRHLSNPQNTDARNAFYAEETVRLAAQAGVVISATAKVQMKADALFI